jgi:limonene-1,2-epoxide hydrolase
MEPNDLLRALTNAVERRDGAAVAALFTEDGVYHDVFYGTFAGRERIAALIDDWFYRDAEDFRWDMHDPASDGRTLHARYVFSYRSKLAGAPPGRVVFEGAAMLRLRDGAIAEYREIANIGPALARLGFAAERIVRLLLRQDGALRERPEAARHVAD